MTYNIRYVTVHPPSMVQDSSSLQLWWLGRGGFLMPKVWFWEEDVTATNIAKKAKDVQQKSEQNGGNSCRRVDFLYIECNMFVELLRVRMALCSCFTMQAEYSQRPLRTLLSWRCTAGTGANQSEASSFGAENSSPCCVEFHACALGEFGDMAQSTKWRVRERSLWQSFGVFWFQQIQQDTDYIYKYTMHTHTQTHAYIYIYIYIYIYLCLYLYFYLYLYSYLHTKFSNIWWCATLNILFERRI